MPGKIINNYQTIEELKQALNQYDKDTLLDTLVYVIDNYVINSSFRETGLPDITGKSEISNIAESNDGSFSGLFVQLKKKYPFPELNCFSVENNKVYFDADSRKIEIKARFISDPEPVKSEIKLQENEKQEDTYKRFSTLEIE